MFGDECEGMATSEWVGISRVREEGVGECGYSEWGGGVKCLEDALASGGEGVEL